MEGYRQVGGPFLCDFGCRPRSPSCSDRNKIRSLYLLDGGAPFRHPFLAGSPSLLVLYRSVPWTLYIHKYLSCMFFFVGIVSCPFPVLVITPIHCSRAWYHLLSRRTLRPLLALQLYLCSTMDRVTTLGVWRCGSTPDLLFPSITKMHRFLKNKIKDKKSSKPPQLGIPTQIADRPPGFSAESGIGPKGGRSLSHRDLGVGWPD